jgi:site-specific recombinase XerC
MTTIVSSSQEIGQAEAPFDEDRLAALAFLARYSGRTLEAYRHDLRNLFQWSTDHGLAVLEVTRTHLELYRTAMEERGLAASTIDRRLLTACGFYRFAHIDGRALSWRPSTPACPCRRFRSRPDILILVPPPCTTGGAQDLDRHAAYVVVAFVAGG